MGHLSAATGNRCTRTVNVTRFLENKKSVLTAHTQVDHTHKITKISTFSPATALLRVNFFDSNTNRVNIAEGIRALIFLAFFIPEKVISLFCQLLNLDCSSQTSKKSCSFRIQLIQHVISANLIFLEF